MRVCSFLRRLGLALHAVGLLMFLLGFMTVNWVIMPYRRGSAGLWQICYNRNFSTVLSDNATGNNTSNHTAILARSHRGVLSVPRSSRDAGSPLSAKTDPALTSRPSSVPSAPTSTEPASQQRKGRIKPGEDPRENNTSITSMVPIVADDPKASFEQHGDTERLNLSFPKTFDKRDDYFHPKQDYSDTETGKRPDNLYPLVKWPKVGQYHSELPSEDQRLTKEDVNPARQDEGQGRARGWQDTDVIHSKGGKKEFALDKGADGTGSVLYDDSLPSHIRLDNDGCRKYGVSDVDAYLHMVRTLMAITAFCYAYGIFDGSTRRARIQPRTSFTRQHRGELLSYTGAFLSYFAVQIYEFGFHSDTLVAEFVSSPQDLRLGWSAECVRFSCLMVAPSVLFLLAPTLRTKLRKLLSDCWAAVGCAGEEEGAGGERRAGLLTTLTHNFWHDPPGNCFRFLTCQRAPLECYSASADSEVEGQGRESFYPSDSRLLQAPPPPYSFLQPISTERSVSAHHSGLTGPDSAGGEQYFLVSGILSVAIPHRAVGQIEPAPSYQEIFPPPTYEEATQGVVTDVLSVSQLPSSPQAASCSANPSSSRLTDSASSCETAAPLSSPPTTAVSLAEQDVSLPTSFPQSMKRLNSQPTSVLSLQTCVISTPQTCVVSTPQTCSFGSPPASSDLSSTPAESLMNTPRSSIPSFLPYTTSPTITPTTQPLNSSSTSSTSSTSSSSSSSSSSSPSSSSTSSSSPLASPTTSQHQARETAAAAVAVVSAAATTSAGQSLILSALRQHPQLQVETEAEEPGPTRSSHLTTSDDSDALATYKNNK
ncbi:hypothetical protein EGW08_020022 [Elysia chlorotica]|uniref:Uncharacterized protein n=1 Tax=Elysia chlorotica TaxID=188477 RepID=A0A3S1AZF6_ELYCH|nr:hypothetical protein EGW08_020022 [Elysia chlorotica]